MALVTGPLHSDSASGKFGGSLVFGSWKGRKYVRSLVTPLNPKSAKQVAVRAMLGFLAKAWAGLSAGAKASYDTLASSRNISAFNVFQSVNLLRFQNWLAPTQTYPAAESSTALTLTTFSATGGAGQVNLSITPSGATSIWAYVILRASASITTPDWTQVIAVIPANGASAVTFVDSPLPAGTYHYVAAAINVDGKMGTVHADVSATVV